VSGPAALLPDVAAIDTLAPEQLAPMLAHLAALQAAIAAKLAAASPAPATSNGAAAGALLDVHEAAARLRVSPDWLYRHARQLPFTRRVGRRAVRFDPESLGRWVAMQRRG
jgi:hypothetical protein